jgi:hypothetical protein
MAENGEQDDRTVVRTGDVTIWNFGDLKKRRPNRAVIFIKSDGSYKKIAEDDSSSFNELWGLGFHSFTELDTSPRTYTRDETIKTRNPLFDFRARVSVTARITQPQKFFSSGKSGPLENAFYHKWFTSIGRAVSVYRPDQLDEAQGVVNEEIESLDDEPYIINGVRILHFSMHLSHDDQYLNLEFARVLNRAFYDFGIPGLIALYPLYPTRRAEIERQITQFRQHSTEESIGNAREFDLQKQRLEWMLERGMIDPDQALEMVGPVKELPDYRRRDQTRAPRDPVDPDRLFSLGPRQLENRANQDAGAKGRKRRAQGGADDASESDSDEA